MKARYYDAQIGRFYSNDPVGFSVGNPMMFNRYGYGNNNPYSYVDPEGATPALPLVGAGAGVGAIVGGVSSFTGAISSGASLKEAAVAGGVGAVIGAASGGAIGGKIGVDLLTSAFGQGVIGGLSNLVSQIASEYVVEDPSDGIDINWGSVGGAVFGGAWAGSKIPQGVSSLAAGIVTWATTTVPAAIGTALGQGEKTSSEEENATVNNDDSLTENAN